MARIIEGGIPGTLVLTPGEAESLALADDPKKALKSLKASHGLPAHAPVTVDNQGEWLNGDELFIRCKLPREGGWRITRKYPNGVVTARHSCVG